MTHSNPERVVPFDRSQASEQLKALGYEPGRDLIFLRYIDPTKTEPADMKTGARSLNQKVIEAKQRQGYDVYFVVNGQGNKDDKVKLGRALWYEHDKMTKELQRELWKTLGLPEPTFQVDTGGKSIHSYWVFDEPIPIEQWEPLQSDLLEYSDGDRTIKNPSRILRLAGCAYMKGDNPGTTQATIISNSGKRYTYPELRTIIPQPQPPEPPQIPKPSYQPSIPDDVPLYICLTKDDRALLDCGATDMRNAQGAKLARNLIGTAERLITLGYRFSGDPYQLFIDYCQCCRQGDGWNQKEWDSIWKSAQKDNPTPSMTDDAIVNCIKAWQRNQLNSRKSSSQGEATEPENKAIATKKRKTKSPPPPSPSSDEAPEENEIEEIDWKEPQSYHRTLGFWKKNKGDGEEFYWEPRCNFDFQIERELSDSDGGGFILQIAPQWTTQQYRVLVRRNALSSPDEFASSISKALTATVTCSLTKWELNALIAARQLAYRSRGEKLFKVCDRYGQQRNALWVFEEYQFTQTGTPTTEEESLFVFDPALGKEDFIPCPQLADPNGIEGLTELINAGRQALGKENANQFILAVAWVVAGLHLQTIKKEEGFFPLLNAHGDPGTGKTIALESALSLIGTNWADDGMISKVTMSAVYEHLSKTGSLPVVWDDPPRNWGHGELDEFCKAMWNLKSRVVRGNRQTPHSTIAFTSNHLMCAEQDAAYTRILRLPFYKGGDPLAIPLLRAAQKKASGSFQQLISIGYDPIEVRKLEQVFLPKLPLAHARIAFIMAMICCYAEKVLAIVGGNENPRQWIIDNLCPLENDAENTGDSLQDFIRCIIALEGKDAIGSWNKRTYTDSNGQKWVAIHPESVWAEVEKAFKPTTYNKKSIKIHLLKIGGVADKVVKFDQSRDEVLAYHRAFISPRLDPEGNPISPIPPRQLARKAWLFPGSLFPPGDDHTPPPPPPPPPTPTPTPTPSPVTKVTEVTAGYQKLPNLVTSGNPDISRDSGASITQVTFVTEKNSNSNEKNGLSNHGENSPNHGAIEDAPGYQPSNQNGYHNGNQTETIDMTGLPVVTDPGNQTVTFGNHGNHGNQDSENVKEIEDIAEQLQEALATNFREMLSQPELLATKLGEQPAATEVVQLDLFAQPKPVPTEPVPLTSFAPDAYQPEAESEAPKPSKLQRNIEEEEAMKALLKKQFPLGATVKRIDAGYQGIVTGYHQSGNVVFDLEGNRGVDIQPPTNLELISLPHSEVRDEVKKDVFDVKQLKVGSRVKINTGPSYRTHGLVGTITGVNGVRYAIALEDPEIPFCEIKPEYLELVEES